MICGSATPSTVQSCAACVPCAASVLVSFLMGAVDPEHYEVCERIGKGTAGVVWQGRNTVTDEQVAVKVIDLETIPDRIPIVYEELHAILVKYEPLRLLLAPAPQFCSVGVAARKRRSQGTGVQPKTRATRSYIWCSDAGNVEGVWLL